MPDPKIDIHKLGFDPTEVRGKEHYPGVRFRWVSTAHPTQLTRQRAKGFKVVDRKERSKLRVTEVGKQVDTTIRVGDLVLCEMPEERAQAIEEAFRERNLAVHREAKRPFKEVVKAVEREVRGRGVDVRDLIVDDESK